MDKKTPPKVSSYSDELKKYVAQEICEGRLGWREAQIKYGIRSPGSIGRWVNKHKQGWVILPKIDSTIHLKKEDLHNLVVQLKKQLKYSQVQNKVYESIITNAEKELKIDIRKKSFTNQSKK